MKAPFISPLCLLDDPFSLKQTKISHVLIIPWQTENNITFHRYKLF